MHVQRPARERNAEAEAARGEEGLQGPGRSGMCHRATCSTHHQQFLGCAGRRPPEGSVSDRVPGCMLCVSPCLRHACVWGQPPDYFWRGGHRAPFSATSYVFVQSRLELSGRWGSEPGLSSPPPPLPPTQTPTPPCRGAPLENQGDEPLPNLPRCYCLLLWSWWGGC